MNEYIVPVATIIVTIAVPFIVNLVKKQEWSTNAKRWLAVGVSLLAGLATGALSGAPTAATLVTWTLSVIGGVQVAYSLFKSVGVTSNWLDALEGVTSKPVD